MRNLILTLVLFTTSFVFSQDTITTNLTKNNINNLVCVTGKVVSIKKALNGQKVNYLNLDSAYPDTIFTVIMTNDYLEKNKIIIDNFKDKFIYVFGKITVYVNDPKQTPQIFNPRRIEVKK